MGAGKKLKPFFAVESSTKERMPAPPKNSSPVAENKDQTIMDHSRTVDDPNGRKNKDGSKRSFIVGTPSQPPWTTWTGILEVRRDSAYGKRIVEMDSSATDGMHPRCEGKESEWVRGIWYAPADWNEIPKL